MRTKRYWLDTGDAAQQPLPSGIADAVTAWIVLPPSSDPTPAQLAAIEATMRLFVEDDLASGVSPRRKIFCDACHQARPMPGFVRYDRYLLCNPCATDYEVARIRGVALTIDQFVHDRSFGAAPEG